MNRVDDRSQEEILEEIRADMDAERRAITLNADADKVASLIPFTKKPSGTPKWAMNAICFEALATGGLMMIATNGHSLIARHDPDGILKTPHGKPLLLSPHAGQTRTIHPVFGGLRTGKPFSHTRLLIHDGHIRQEDGRPGSYDIEPMLIADGAFPNWREILGTFLTAKPYPSTTCLPADILARFDLHPKRKDDAAHAVLLWQEPSSDGKPASTPIFITSPYPDSADMIGAFMPVNLRRQADALDLLVPHRRWFLDALPAQSPNGAASSNGDGASA